MRHEEARLHLDDYVDGALDADRRAAVDAHVRSCTTCSSEVVALRSLLGDLSGLPRSIQPRRDLWPGIDRAVADRPLGGRSLWSGQYWLTAAALLLVAGSATLALHVARRGDVRASAPAVLVQAHLTRTQSAYLSAVAELEGSLDAVKPTLAPETAARIERNLAIIDAAIAEIREALASDPVNRELLDMLWRRYRAKLDLLQHASQLAGNS